MSCHVSFCFLGAFLLHKAWRLSICDIDRSTVALWVGNLPGVRIVCRASKSLEPVHLSQSFSYGIRIMGSGSSLPKCHDHYFIVRRGKSEFKKQILNNYWHGSPVGAASVPLFWNRVKKHQLLFLRSPCRKVTKMWPFLMNNFWNVSKFGRIPLYGFFSGFCWCSLDKYFKEHCFGTTTSSRLHTCSK